MGALKPAKKPHVKKELDLGDTTAIQPQNPEFLNTPMSGAGALNLPTIKTKDKKKTNMKTTRKQTGKTTKVNKIKRSSKEQAIIDMNEKLEPYSPQDFTVYKI